MTLWRTPPQTRSRPALRDTYQATQIQQLLQSPLTYKQHRFNNYCRVHKHYNGPICCNKHCSFHRRQIIGCAERIAFATTELQKEVDRRVSFETELACLRAQQSNFAKPRKPDSFSGNQSSKRDARLWLHSMKHYLHQCHTPQNEWVNLIITYLECDAAR